METIGFIAIGLIAIGWIILWKSGFFHASAPLEVEILGYKEEKRQ